MASLNVLIGLWLLAAPAARAQRVVMPVEGLAGRASIGAPVPMIAPSVTPALSVTAPALSLAPSLSAPAAVSIAPVPVAAAAAPIQAAAPLKLSAGTAALAEFSKLDLKSAPAADLKGGADALMERVLGGEAAEAGPATFAAPAAAAIPLAAFAPDPAREPAKGPGVHLLSKPLHATVELGKMARVVYYALEAVSSIVKAALTWHATGSPAAAAAMLAFDALKAPGWLASESLADLNLRYWWRKLSTLKRLADVPGVTRIRVLTTGQAEFSGMLARRKDNTGLVFVDADGALPAEVPGFGAPIAVSSLLDGGRATLTLIRDGKASATAWTPTLAELLSGKPIPADVAASWRADLDAGKTGKLRRLFDFKKDKDLRVEASLSDGKGGASPLGTVVFGGSVKSLVGLGRWDRAGALFGRKPPARAIPISDTVVERGGERRVEGALRRAWRELTGALIVRP